MAAALGKGFVLQSCSAFSPGQHGKDGASPRLLLHVHYAHHDQKSGGDLRDVAKSCNLIGRAGIPDVALRRPGLREGVAPRGSREGCVRDRIATEHARVGTNGVKC